MVRTASADDLQRRAREAVGMRDVRVAVRDLTLHALRGRLLTAAHIATVARTVGEGIDSSDIAATAPVRGTRQGAWAGLEDALDQALHAVELAAREYAEGRAQLSSDERAQVLAGIDQLERSLAQGWEYPRKLPPSLRARISAVNALLRLPGPAGPVADAPDPCPCSGVALSLVASGVLLGLSEVGRRPADAAPG